MATKDYILDQLFSLTNTNDKDNILIGSAVLWSRSAINAVAPFLQVGAQQTVRASRAYVLYASQPLCVSILRFVLLKETTSNQVLMSASMFLITIFFAATANSRFQLWTGWVRILPIISITTFSRWNYCMIIIYASYTSNLQLR